MIEIYKIIDNIAAIHIDSLFLFGENVHDIRDHPFYGKLWGDLPQVYKSQTSLRAFKVKMRKWNAGICVSITNET